MDYIFAALLGALQGLTEFLPISSSGHLALMQSLSFSPERFGQTFDVLLHLGTLIAVCIVYFRDICAIVPAFFTMIGKFFHGKRKLVDYTPDERLVLFLILACIPLLIVPLFDDYVDLIGSLYPKIVGGILILNGILLIVSDFLKDGKKAVDELRPRSVLLVGLCQAAAVLPGLSRSGSTITGGIAVGLDRKNAVRFSFLLSIPAILGANLFKIPDVIDEMKTVDSASSFALEALIGIVSAALFGILAMKIIHLLSKKANFRFFGVYCILIGVIVLIFA